MTRRSRMIRVGGWLAMLAVLIALVVRAEYSADMSVFLPRSPTPEQALLVDQLRDGMVSRLVLIAIAGGEPRERAQVSQTMTAALRATTTFQSITNGADAGLEADRTWLFEQRYLLSPAVNEERFSVAGLRAALSETLDWLVSPAGMLIEELVPRDPTGELIAILERLDDGPRPRREDGVWVSRDGQEALLLALTRASGADLDGQESALAEIDAAFEIARTGAHGLRLVTTGPGVFAVESRATIKGEVTRIALTAAAIIVALLLLIYRSPLLLVLGLLPVMTGVLAGIAAVSLGFGVVHGLTIGFGAALIGEAVDYGIYLFVQRGGAQSDREAMADFWPTIRLGLLTSVCGFGVMLGSGFPGLAQLGLYSTTGLIAAALVTRLVLPALVPDGLAPRDLGHVGQQLARATRQLARLRWLVPALCVAGLLIVWLHRDRLWDDSLLALSPIPPAAQALDARLRADLGAPETSVLVAVDAPEREAVLRQVEALAPAFDALVERGAIAGWDSPARYLPSRAIQTARLGSLPDPDALAARLAAASAGLPLQAERLAPFLADVEAARTAGPIGPESLAGTAFGLAVDSMLTQTEQGWRALLPLRAAETNPIDVERLRQTLAESARMAGVSVRLLELKRESDGLYADYLQEAIWLSSIGLVAILALLALALRSWRRVWRVMLSLLAAVLTVTSALVLAGQSLILMHLVGLLLVVAVGSNYALFFVRGMDRPGGPAPRTLASLLFANLTTLAGFGLLATSSVPVLQAIGVTVGPGAVLALLFAAILSHPRPRETPAGTSATPLVRRER